jgi:pyruvate dehydrogenase E1 component
MKEYYIDQDKAETKEWLESLEGVIKHEGNEKADFLLRELTESARRQGVSTSPGVLSPYTNTILPGKSEKMPPDDSYTAMKVAAYVRWNAMAMVARANKEGRNLGGHIASFASSAVLYEVGFNWFFRGADAEFGQDLIFFQGHSAPGIYARAFVEGRLTEEQMNYFRRETEGKGLSSYPHPWLMPDFWQFPTVSMGLGPLMGVYQARFMKYMDARELAKAGDRKVWVFMGDGESDEPESQAALALAARENLDNLIYVVNCNLQRLDGPVRGNGKIIQELEGNFRGAGWNVIKIIWGTEWDEIMNRDTEGLLLRKISSMVDGEFQTLRAHGPENMRKTLFGDDERLLKLVEDKTDKELWQMSRGGHDPRKVYAAFAEAGKHTGEPTVILVKTVKGFGMGKEGEAAMGAHNQKKMNFEGLKEFRDRFHVPLEDDQLESLPFIQPPEGSDEAEFIKRSRKRLGGPVPARTVVNENLKIPDLSLFKALLGSSGDREMSTTMAFVRMLGMLAKDAQIGKRIVPIVPDEARTFGMEGLFRQLGIYAPTGQLYEPADSDSLMWYREDAKGQILEEGINEAGAFSSWISAGTAHANYGMAMIPFYTYYSIFGFQRIGDLAWAAGDSRTRGFLMGATAGRTTLNGEGLQHQDGHGLLAASTLPTCRAYDPAFSYELAVIIQAGLQEMYGNNEDVFYYITLMNENYVQPAMPEGAEEGIVKGIYQFRKAGKGTKRVQLLGSGTIFREVIAAADILMEDYGIEADIWGIPGVNQLARDGYEVDRWNLMNPGGPKRVSFVSQVMKDSVGPVVISTDYMRAYPEQIRKYIPGNVTILGTDGYGRSDSRENLRDFFEVDKKYIVLAALNGLADEGIIDVSIAKEAVSKFSIQTGRPAPWTK